MKTQAATKSSAVAQPKGLTNNQVIAMIKSGVDDDTMEVAVGRLLLEAGLSVGVATVPRLMLYAADKVSLGVHAPALQPFTRRLVAWATTMTSDAFWISERNLTSLCR